MDSSWGAQLSGHRRPVRLVLRVQIVAEGLALGVEDHRRELGRHFRLQSLQHVRHAVRGAGGISLRVGERGHRVKRAIQVRGAVHQDETTARRGHGAFACRSLGAGGAGTVSISAPKPPPQDLHPPPVRTEVPDGEPRCGADVDYTAREAETALEVIDKPDPGPACRVEIVIRRADDDGPRRAGQQALQSGESGGGIPRYGERLDPIESQCIVATANADGEIRAG